MVKFYPVFVKNQNEKETNLSVVLFSSLNDILGDFKRPVPMNILGPSLYQLLMEMGDYKQNRSTYAFISLDANKLTHKTEFDEHCLL